VAPPGDKYAAEINGPVVDVYRHSFPMISGSPFLFYWSFHSSGASDRVNRHMWSGGMGNCSQQQGGSARKLGEGLA
jgi:hypothetical protein